MTAAPKWAQDLVVNAILYWQQEYGVEVALPELTWRRTHPRHTFRGYRIICPPQGYQPVRSSGYCDHGVRIVVTAGSSRQDQKVVLLHELAHVLADPRGHSAHFWDAVWELFRWGKVPVRYAKEREGNYRKRALVAYHRGRRRLTMREGAA